MGVDQFLDVAQDFLPHEGLLDPKVLQVTVFKILERVSILYVFEPQLLVNLGRGDLDLILEPGEHLLP